MMETDSNSIYAKLYDIVKEKTPLSFSKEVFMATKGEDMEHCDLLKLHGFDRRDFFVGLHAVVLRRLPESEDVVARAVSVELPEDVWQGEYLKRILASPEYVTKGMTCINNTYSKETIDTAGGMSFRRRFIVRVYQIYQKSPGWLRKIEKKLAAMAGLSGV